jgi:branched-chain amino acid transport system permease protein
MLMMLPQLAVSGIANGMLYALIALSMTLAYRATTVLNFGQGDMAAAGAYAGFVLVGAGLPLAAALALALVGLFAFGFLMQRVLLQPIMRGPHLALATMALAVGYALRGAARLRWGNEVLNLPRPYPQGAIDIGSVVVTNDALVITAAVLVLLVLMAMLFWATEAGRLIRAVFQTERGAALVGINVPLFHGVMWGAGAALGAAGGVMLAMIVPLTPDMGEWVLVRGFAAMTLGGFGSLPGAVVGGVVLGVAEEVLGFYVSTVFTDITAYLVTILVLLIRPRGLFGKQALARV